MDSSVSTGAEAAGEVATGMAGTVVAGRASDLIFSIS